jgi:hypothetical protein
LVARELIGGSGGSVRGCFQEGGDRILGSVGNLAGERVDRMVLARWSGGRELGDPGGELEHRVATVAADLA